MLVAGLGGTVACSFSLYEFAAARAPSGGRHHGLQDILPPRVSMRILIVFHGWFPTTGRPVAGGALRAWHHAEALRAAGHDVHTVTRAQDAVPDGPPGFANGPELVAHARRISPDVLLCVQPEEAPRLAPLGLPTVVDLYAPRILEAQFQDATGVEAVNTLRAIRAGDFFLFSNPRQRFYFLGLLALAGVDVRSHDHGAVVPLVAAQGPERKLPRHPLFVMGGVSWPWLDPVEALGRAVAHLNKRRRGKILVLGHKPVLGDSPVMDLQADLPPSKRLEYGGVLPYDDLLATYARATAAIDLMGSTPERSMAVAFRHMDYLGCGLPMIVGREHVLADTLASSGAGWADLPIEQALDRALDDKAAVQRASSAARELARARYSRDVCEAPLLAWLERPARRERSETPLGRLAEVNARAARAEAERAEALRVAARLEAEVEAKRAEVDGLVQQTRVLSVATERLAGSVAEVAGFKREAIAVLGGAQAQAQEQLATVRVRLGTVEADNRKKSAELDAVRREKADLLDRYQEQKRTLAGLEERLAQGRVIRTKLADARDAALGDARKKSGEVDALAREKALLREQIVSLRQRLERISGLEGQLQAVQRDLVKKDGEVDALLREKRLLRDQIELTGQIGTRAQAEAVRLGIEAGRLAGDLAEITQDARKKSGELQALAQERDLVRDRLAVLEDRQAVIAAATCAAELAAVRESLDASRAREAALGAAMADARADGVKKGAEMEAVRLALTRARDDLEAARAELDAVTPRAVRTQAELDIARQQLDASRAAETSLREGLASAQADMAAKGAQVAALQREAEQLRGAEMRALAGLEKLRADAEQRAVAGARAEETAGQLRARLESLEESLADTQADIDKKNSELELAWQERERLEGIITELRTARR